MQRGGSMSTRLLRCDRSGCRRVRSDRSRVQSEERHTATNDPYEDGAQETRQDFTTNDFQITRALDSLLLSATSISHRRTMRIGASSRRCVRPNDEGRGVVLTTTNKARLDGVLGEDSR